MPFEGSRLLLVAGDPHDVNVWSGIPHFLLRAARDQGVLDGGVPLFPHRLRLRRLGWCALNGLLTGRPAGFQYSRYFGERLFAQASLPPGPLLLVTHFPLLPPRHETNWTVVPYIDATLRQNFEDYGAGRRLARRTMVEAIARERDVYQAAPVVVCMSRWAAADVTTSYGVPDTRCRVILPGANMDDDGLADAPSRAPPTKEFVRLGFVGKDWRRKGLNLVIEAADSLARRGTTVEILVIGPAPHELPTHPSLRALGFIDKHRQMKEFIEIIRSCHFGVLPSSVEALGISTLEFLRLGVPALGTRVGGIVDALPPDLGILVEPNARGAQIADALWDYLENPLLYSALSDRVRGACARFSWGRAAAELGDTLAECAT